MAINFPDTPTSGDSFTASGRTWIYDGTVWNSQPYADDIVNQVTSAIVDSAPETLDTLNELAAALGDDANFASTVTTALGGKQDIVSGVSDTEIGYLDGVTSSVQTQLDDKSPLRRPIQNISSSTTLNLTHANNFIRVQGEGDVTITIPPNVFSAGDTIDFIANASNAVTFSAGDGFNIASPDSKVQLTTLYGVVTVFFSSATTAYLIGNLA